MNKRNENDPRQKIPKDRHALEQQISEIIGLEDRLFVFLLFVCGARISEVLSLRKMDFDISRDKMTLLITIPTEKSKQIHERGLDILIDVHKELILQLLDYVDKLESDEEKLFKFSRNRGWRIVKRFNPEYFPHLFRHYLASALSSEGISQNGIMSVFGWTDLRTYNKYRHVNPNERAKINI